MQNSKVNGGAVDADPRQRPGVPMELKPEPRPGSQVPVTPQQTDVPINHEHVTKSRMPPVFGTGEPPKGLSGALRTLAYKYPDHWARHWMVLLLADRVDVWEHRLRRSLPAGLAIGSVFLVGGLTWKLIRR